MRSVFPSTRKLFRYHLFSDRGTTRESEVQNTFFAETDENVSIDEVSRWNLSFILDAFKNRFSVDYNLIVFIVVKLCIVTGHNFQDVPITVMGCSSTNHVTDNESDNEIEIAPKQEQTDSEVIDDSQTNKFHKKLFSLQQFLYFSQLSKRTKSSCDGICIERSIIF